MDALIRLLSFFETATSWNPINIKNLETYASKYKLTFGFEAEVVATIPNDKIQDLINTYSEFSADLPSEDEYTSETENDNATFESIQHYALLELEKAVFSHNINKIDIYMRGAGYEKWQVVQDSSVGTKSDKINNEVAGLEIISPVFSTLEDMTMGLQQVFSLIEKNEYFSTDSTTGLHINIGFSKDLIEKMDLLKMLVFLGEENILSDFSRTGNGYAVSIIALIKTLSDKGLMPLNENEIKQIANSKEREKAIEKINFHLLNNADHHYAVDLFKLRKGYIEFRMAGGKGYERDYTKVLRTIMRYVAAIHISVNRTVLLKEYLRKLGAIVAFRKENLKSKEELPFSRSIDAVNFMVFSYPRRIKKIRPDEQLFFLFGDLIRLKSSFPNLNGFSHSPEDKRTFLLEFKPALVKLLAVHLKALNNLSLDAFLQVMKENRPDELIDVFKDRWLSAMIASAWPLALKNL